MADTETSTGANGSGTGNGVTWARRSELPPFSPAPGVQIQPVIGESVMTCWIALEPGAVVPEHSHANEQLGVVVEGSVSLTIAGETRELVAGDAYVVPRHMVHGGVAGAEGVLIIDTFVPSRDDYVKAWRAVIEGQAASGD